MTLYQILCILGIPTVMVGILKVTFSQIKGVKLGVQALLRAQMIHDYNKWSERGYAPIYARENFQNCWKQYPYWYTDSKISSIFAPLYGSKTCSALKSYQKKNSLYVDGICGVKSWESLLK